MRTSFATRMRRSKTISASTRHMAIAPYGNTHGVMDGDTEFIPRPEPIIEANMGDKVAKYRDDIQGLERDGFACC